MTPGTVLNSFRGLCWILVVLQLAGCGTLGYYSQAVRGHAKLMMAREPVDRVMSSPHTPPELRAQLTSAREILRFADQNMALSVGRRYSRYADLGRDDAVYNVVAAPELSLTAKRWCSPVVGCVPYRGLFSLSAARKYAEELRAEGFETSMTGSAAYSTLGWFNDPLLNTFIDWPEGELANLLIHELAHSVVWIRGDVRLNESFASFVGHQGASMWLQTRPEARHRYHEARASRAAYNRWARSLRQALSRVYQSRANDEQKRGDKARVLESFRACYEANKEHIGGGRYDNAVASVNNARLALLATYNSHSDAFSVLFAEAGRQWPEFYTAVEELGRLDKAQRREKLLALAASYEKPESTDMANSDSNCENTVVTTQAALQ